MSRFLNADAFASTGQGLLGNNMFAYCRNNPVIRKDASGMDDFRATGNDEYKNPLDLFFRGGGAGIGGTAGAGSSAGGVTNFVATGIICGIIYEAATTITTTKEKHTVLVDAATLESSRNTAVYYGINFYGGNMNYITGPMTFAQADAWVTATAFAGTYSSRESWGLYTVGLLDAASMAVYLGAPNALTPGLPAPATSIIPDVAKSPRYYSHFHTAGRQVHGISAPTFHIWYGLQGG